MPAIRLIISGIIAFCFYAAWAYYANSLVTDDKSLLMKAALVQGSYSGTITLFFTFILEFFHAKFGHAVLCLGFLTPHWSKTDEDVSCEAHSAVSKALTEINKKSSISGMWLVPIPALVIQSILVIAINVIFATPNLWLTVAPSILFSAIYGLSYSIALTKHQQRLKVTNS